MDTSGQRQDGWVIGNELVRVPLTGGGRGAVMTTGPRVPEDGQPHPPSFICAPQSDCGGTSTPPHTVPSPVSGAPVPGGRPTRASSGPSRRQKQWRWHFREGGKGSVRPRELQFGWRQEPHPERLPPLVKPQNLLPARFCFFPPWGRWAHGQTQSLRQRPLTTLSPCPTPGEGTDKEPA